MEEIERPDPEPGRRHAGEILAPGRDGDGRIGTTEVGLPADTVAPGVPQPEAGVVQLRIDGAIVEHRVRQDL